VIAEAGAVDGEAEAGDVLVVVSTCDHQPIGLVQDPLSPTGIEVSGRAAEPDGGGVGQQVGQPLWSHVLGVEQPRSRGRDYGPHGRRGEQDRMLPDQLRRRDVVRRREVLVDERRQVGAEGGQIDDAPSELLGTGLEVIDWKQMRRVLRLRRDPPQAHRSVVEILRRRRREQGVLVLGVRRREVAGRLVQTGGVEVRDVPAVSDGAQRFGLLACLRKSTLPDQREAERRQDGPVVRQQFDEPRQRRQRVAAVFVVVLRLEQPLLGHLLDDRLVAAQDHPEDEGPYRIDRREASADLLDPGVLVRHRRGDTLVEQHVRLLRSRHRALPDRVGHQ
jgi:hypothetical protein